VQQNLDERWSEQYKKGRDYTLATRQAIDKILSYVDSAAPKTCLDIGCGTGHLTRELYNRGYTCTGVDTSTKAIELAKVAAIAPAKDLTYIHLSSANESFVALPGAPFGLITCKLVYAFVEDKPAFLSRVKDVLAPHGIFVVITPLPEDVAPEQRAITASPQDMHLLTNTFTQVAMYKDFGFTYFIGKKA